MICETLLLQEMFQKECAAGEDTGGDTEESGTQLCTF